jgi:uncharacterized protein (DUF1330 family)
LPSAAQKKATFGPLQPRQLRRHSREAASDEEKQMPAFLIVEHIITDAAKFDEYRIKVGPMIAKHGGRYLTKGGSHKLPEGGHWSPERVVIIEFPDMQSLNAWYSSPEYQPLIELRKACTSDLDMLITLEGA